MGGSKDPKNTCRLNDYKSQRIDAVVTKVDENGVRRFAISDLVKKNCRHC